MPQAAAAALIRHYPSPDSLPPGAAFAANLPAAAAQPKGRGRFDPANAFCRAAPRAENSCAIFQAVMLLSGRFQLCRGGESLPRRQCPPALFCLFKICAAGLLRTVFIQPF